jgi:alkanesulfonate monooxygenase SsuD/methylene tetrahydromethanopterin reductase-like flavin-dependent oxidoreductase (luciferase family)
MTASRPLAVGLTPMETRREVVLHVATRAEELGYSALFVAEGWAHDVSVLLAEVAVRTTRLRLGTGVLNVWGRSPAAVAMLSASLAELSGGRFELGLGAGSPQLAEGLHGVPFHEPVARLGAVTRQVRSLLAGGRGEPLPGGSRPLRLALRPSAPVPIQLAALGPASVRLCGELADAWYPFLLPLSGVGDGVRRLDEGVARGEPGRRRPGIRPGLPVAVSADPAAARRLASWWVAFYLTSMGPLYARTLRARGLGEAVDLVLAANRERGTVDVPAAAQVLLDELTVWGEPARARATLDRWYAAGADLPVVVLPPGRDVGELDLVLEALRPGGPAVSRGGPSRPSAGGEKRSNLSPVAVRMHGIGDRAEGVT